MRVDLFDFQLPEALIALRPIRPPEAARLLHVRPGAAFEDRHVGDLPDLLRPGDALVLNDTWVMPTALSGVRPARGDAAEGVRIKFNLIERVDAATWNAFARPGKRLRGGDIIRFAGELSAEVSAKAEGGVVRLRFDRSGAALDAALEAVGRMPLPPYIADRRPADAQDREDYQTRFADPAEELRSVAAPTAGLHLTPAMLDRLEARGVRIVRLRLGVGAGTFLPVKGEDTAEHQMHPESFAISEAAVAAIDATREAGGRVVAAGTTSLRALESAADEAGRLRPTRASTQLFITPGYRFRVVEGLFTNFHLPRSTLFMLVAAFSGLECMRAAYAHAIAQRYRFYSYGDASLLWRSHG